jgi:hypothetical protein
VVIRCSSLELEILLIILKDLIYNLNVGYHWWLHKAFKAISISHLYTYGDFFPQSLRIPVRTSEGIS